MTRVTGAVHITDSFNNSNENKEGPPSNLSKSLLCSGKGFPYLTVQAIITNVRTWKFITCNQHPSCRYSSSVLSVQRHLKLDESLE